MIVHVVAEDIAWTRRRHLGKPSIVARTIKIFNYAQEGFYHVVDYFWRRRNHGIDGECPVAEVAFGVRLDEYVGYRETDRLFLPTTPVRDASENQTKENRS